MPPRLILLPVALASSMLVGCTVQNGSSKIHDYGRLPAYNDEKCSPSEGLSDGLERARKQFGCERGYNDGYELGINRSEIEIKIRRANEQIRSTQQELEARKRVINNYEPGTDPYLRFKGDIAILGQRLEQEKFETTLLKDKLRHVDRKISEFKSYHQNWQG